MKIRNGNEPTEITVPVEMLEFAIDPAHPEWWSYDDLIESFGILDKFPDTPMNELPMFHELAKVNKLHGHTPTDEQHATTCRWHRDMYFDIRDNGYDYSKPKTPIRVRIDDDGRIFVGNGHHRVAALLHIGVPEIKVTVKDRYKAWMNFKQRLYDVYGKKYLYQPMDHPDFSDWSVNKMACDEVLKFILDWVHVDGQLILDIGSCTGWFCYKLAEYGATMHGIDTDERKIEMAEYQRTYREAYQDNPRFAYRSFQNHLHGTVHYDTVLLLNVLHHYLRKDVDKAMAMMKQISEHSRQVVMQLSTKIPITHEDFINRVLRETQYDGFTTYTPEDTPLRPVILFSKGSII